MSPRGKARPCRNRCGLPLAAALLPACLDGAPEFPPRPQIPPIVFLGQVEPPIGAFYDGPIPFTLNVPFRSEDVNVDLEARLFLDLSPGAASQTPVDVGPVPASTYDDDSRSVSMDWTQALPRGCHSITMILTYERNFDRQSGLPADESLAARVVWWLSVSDLDGDVSIASCPASSQSDL